MKLNDDFCTDYFMQLGFSEKESIEHANEVKRLYETFKSYGFSLEDVCSFHNYFIDIQKRKN
jgi:hypothetical protein